MENLLTVLRHRVEVARHGYPLAYPLVVIAASTAAVIGAIVQRFPWATPWSTIAAALVGVISLTIDIFQTRMLLCSLLCMVSTALFLVDPVPADLAPLLLVNVTMISAALRSTRFGLAVGGGSVALLLAAWQLGHLASPGVYILALACGWMVGYMVLTQKQLAESELATLRARAEQATGLERERIAREIHDVIAHSLTITMLNVTGARRALQEDRDIPAALDALADAERLGRQAMSEIRYTVHVLADQDAASSPDIGASPTPRLADIATLVRDSRNAGVDVDLQVSGDVSSVPAPVGSALFRIMQESLANVVKHGPVPRATVTLVAGSDVVLRVENPSSGIAPAADPAGSGIVGMKRRARALGGLVDAGTYRDSWVVRAEFPLTVTSPAEAARG